MSEPDRIQRLVVWQHECGHKTFAEPTILKCVRCLGTGGWERVEVMPTHLTVERTPVQCFLSDLDLIATMRPKTVEIYTEQIQAALEDSGLRVALKEPVSPHLRALLREEER